MDRIYSWKWKLIYWLHYWFGTHSWDEQIGDFICSKELLSENKTVASFRDEIITALRNLHAEIIGKVSLIYQNQLPLPPDPLLGIGSRAWKCKIRVHTRRSWAEYQRRLLSSTIHFTKPKVY